MGAINPKLRKQGLSKAQRSHMLNSIVMRTLEYYANPKSYERGRPIRPPEFDDEKDSGKRMVWDKGRTARWAIEILNEAFRQEQAETKAEYDAVCAAQAEREVSAIKDVEGQQVIEGCE